MHSTRPVKEEEFHGGSSSFSVNPAILLPPPEGMEGLNEIGPPPFLTKTLDMVDDPSTDRIISWSRGSNSFVVWEPHTFSMSILPRYFKHNNFSSFIRQLNTYGFRKVDPDKWEFANEEFLRGHKHLLKNITRKKAPHRPSNQQQALVPCLEVGRLGFDGELNQLRRDKQVLLMEVMKLRQQHQNTQAQLHDMEERLQGTESRQQQMMNFMARALQSPSLLQHVLQQNERRKELDEAAKKRRTSMETGTSSRTSEFDNEMKTEPQEFGDLHGSELSELEALALEMQGFRRPTRSREAQEEQELECESEDKTFDEIFWEELLNENIEKGINGTYDREEDDYRFAESVWLLWPLLEEEIEIGRPRDRRRKRDTNDQSHPMYP